MRFLHLIVGSALLLSTGLAQARERLTPDARLAKILAGRTAGEPVNCIPLRNIRSSEIIDKTAIVYTTNNGTIYVNRPNGASFLDDDQIMVNKVYTSQLCSIDIVNLIDRSTRFTDGSISLEKFTPYPRPPKAPR
jgi:hypothetical protein